MGEKIDLKKDLRKLAGPIFIEVLLVMTMGAVDTFMLSQYDDHAVAAVGVVNQLVMFSFLIFQIINMGTTVLCSQYLGAGLRNKMIQVTGFALILNFLFGILVSAGLYFGAGTLLTLMGLRPELMKFGLPYMKIVGMFAFFQAMHLTISASLRADHKAIYPMLVVIVVNIVNIGGNYGLIFGNFGLPALGVQGAAIATAFSRGTAMVLLFIILFTKHIRSFPISLFTPFPWTEVKNLMKIGLPSAGENMSYDLQQVVITYFINKIGNDELTVRSYVVNIVMFGYIFCICMAQGGSISIGHLIGEHKPKAAFIMGKYVLKWSLIVGVIFSTTFAFCGDKIFPYLTDNPHIIALGCTILFWDILLEIGRTVNIYATTVLRATGDVYFPFYLGVIIQWGVGVVAGYVLGLDLEWGLVGMWIAFILDENIRGAVFIWRWNSMRWVKKSFV